MSIQVIVKVVKVQVGGVLIEFRVQQTQPDGKVVPLSAGGNLVRPYFLKKGQELTVNMPEENDPKADVPAVLPPDDHTNDPPIG